jgi:C1A family cysteine protease
MIGKAVDHTGVERKLNYVWDGPTRIKHLDLFELAPLNLLKTADPAPPFMTIIGKCPKITDQGQQGSCTGHSSVAPYYIAEVNAGRTPIIPSPAYLYYNERLINGQTDQDAGASISDIYRAGNKYGIVDESLMPYDDSDFTTPPSQAAYDAGKALRAHIYAPVPQLLENLIGCLHHGGFPVSIGVSVYQSFMDARDGNIPMPGANEDVLGGHALSLVGYNNTDQAQTVPELPTPIPPKSFVFRNSWGILWGKAGYGFFPFEYVLSPQLASDMWMIRAI